MWRCWERIEFLVSSNPMQKLSPSPEHPTFPSGVNGWRSPRQQYFCLLANFWGTPKGHLGFLLCPFSPSLLPSQPLNTKAPSLRPSYPASTFHRRGNETREMKELLQGHTLDGSWEHSRKDPDSPQGALSTPLTSARQGVSTRHCCQLTSPPLSPG